MPLAQELSDIEARIIAGAEIVSQPVFVHMLGIPGSGKSSFLKILHKASQYKPTMLGFDQVMQSLPSYQQTEDKIAGFAQYEIPARSTGYKILNGLIAKRAHILFDNGGSAESHPDLLRHARDEQEYELAFVWMKTPLEIARARVDFRAVEQGQHTPLHYLEDRAAKLDKLMSTYRSLTPHFYEFENGHDGIENFTIAAEKLSLQIVKDTRL